MRALLRWLPCLLPLYLVRFHIGPLPTTALECVMILLVVWWIATKRFSGFLEGWRRIGSWQTPIVAWMAASLIAAFVAPSVWHGFGLWRAYILEPLLVFVMLADVLRTENDHDALRRSCYAITMALAVWAIMQFVTGIGIPHPWNVSIALGRRATGPFPFPNALALFVAPVACYAFTRFLVHRTRLEAATAFLGCVAIILARSEGAFAAFVVVAFLALVHDRRSRLLGITLALVALASVSLIPMARHAFIREVTFHGWSGQVRVMIWKETWQMLKEHPLFGAGFGGYPTVFKPYHRATFIEIFQYPHTILFNVWSETGLLGIVAFGWIIIRWIRRAKSFDALAPLLAVLIQGLVDVPYFKNDLSILFWMLIFLTTV